MCKPLKLSKNIEKVAWTGLWFETLFVQSANTCTWRRLA